MFQAEVLVKKNQFQDASRVVAWILEQKPFDVQAAQHLANIYGLSQQHTRVRTSSWVDLIPRP